MSRPSYSNHKHQSHSNNSKYPRSSAISSPASKSHLTTSSGTTPTKSILPHRSASHRESNLDQNPPVIPERTHKSHGNRHANNSLDTPGYMGLPVKKNSSINPQNKDNSLLYKYDLQQQRNTKYSGSNYSNSTSGDYQVDKPAHTDESYHVNPHPSYIWYWNCIPSSCVT